MARASALHAEGHRFDSDILHIKKAILTGAAWKSSSRHRRREAKRDEEEERKVERWRWREIGKQIVLY